MCGGVGGCALATPSLSGTRKPRPLSTLWLLCRYLEWIGHHHRDHPAWLDPSIFALTAGFDTLDYEARQQQPQGLFARLRSGDETAGGLRAWLGAMTRFHGLGKGKG